MDECIKNYSKTTPRVPALQHIPFPCTIMIPNDRSSCLPSSRTFYYFFPVVNSWRGERGRAGRERAWRERQGGGELINVTPHADWGTKEVADSWVGCDEEDCILSPWYKVSEWAINSKSSNVFEGRKFERLFLSTEKNCSIRTSFILSDSQQQSTEWFDDCRQEESIFTLSMMVQFVPLVQSNNNRKNGKELFSLLLRKYSWYIDRTFQYAPLQWRTDIYMFMVRMNNDAP